METKKITLQAEELRIILTAASIWFTMAEDPKDPEMVEMTKRGKTILHKVARIADEQTSTFDIIAR